MVTRKDERVCVAPYSPVVMFQRVTPAAHTSTLHLASALQCTDNTVGVEHVYSHVSHREA